MAESPSLQPDAILVQLGIPDASAIRPVTGGSATAIWRITWRGHDYALRVFRADQESTCQTELATMQTAEAGGIPVPAIIRQGTWEQHPVLLLSWLDGQPLTEQLLAHPLTGGRPGHAFGQMQAAIHRLTPPFTDSTGWIEWAGDEPDLKDRLYHLKSRRTALLHLDYHPRNVMTEGSRITGVLDWANASAGDPRADFARTYTILRVEPYSPDGDSLPMSLFRRELEHAWRSGYHQAGGSLGEESEMALFYAWAGAVMIRDLSPRIDRPGQWLQDHHFESVRRWRDHWKRRAGIPVK